MKREGTATKSQVPRRIKQSFAEKRGASMRGNDTASAISGVRHKSRTVRCSARMIRKSRSLEGGKGGASETGEGGLNAKLFRRLCVEITFRYWGQGNNIQPKQA